MIPLFPGPVTAEEANASTKIMIRGTAPAVCMLSSPKASGAENAVFSGNLLTIPDLIDAATSTVKRSRITLTYPKVTCNYAARVTILSARSGLQPVGQLADVGPSGGQASKKVDYTVTARWGSDSAPILDTAGADGRKQVFVDAFGAKKSDLMLMFSIEKGTIPVLKRTLEDTIIIEIGPVY
jgi:hypothetical protein